MPVFGEKSKAKRATCHPLIQKVTGLAIRRWDFTFIHGFRGEEIQNELFRSGLSKTPWPQSQHNHLSTITDVSEGYAAEVGEELSMAFDFAPWHKNSLSASQMTICMRWGSGSATAGTGTRTRTSGIRPLWILVT